MVDYFEQNVTKYSLFFFSSSVALFSVYNMYIFIINNSMHAPKIQSGWWEACVEY